jgi:hypothetical protein
MSNCIRQDFRLFCFLFGSLGIAMKKKFGGGVFGAKRQKHPRQPCFTVVPKDPFIF